MLEEILDHLHNYFVVKDGIYKGEFSISSGTLTLDFLQPNQYFKVIGSVFNDGVYQYPHNDFVDETFDGEIWAMAVPPKIISLSEEIGQWCINNQSHNSGYLSESFGGYSYQHGVNSRTGAPIGWQDVFQGRLNEWRKIS